MDPGPFGARAWDNTVAAAVAVIALWQARSARDSADSARRAAKAAEEQVGLTRSQFEAYMADRDEASGPDIHVMDAKLVMDGEWFVSATLKMVNGPPLSYISVRARGDDVRGLAERVGSLERLADRTVTNLSSGAEFEVVAQMEWNRTSNLLTLDIECVEGGGAHRRWLRSCTASPSEPKQEKGFPGLRYR